MHTARAAAAARRANGRAAVGRVNALASDSDRWRLLLRVISRVLGRGVEPPQSSFRAGGLLAGGGGGGGRSGSRELELAALPKTDDAVQEEANALA